MAGNMELTRRALAAWHRTGEEPLPNAAEVRELEGRRYVALIAGGSVVGVYRYHESNGQLRRMRRPPAAVLEA